MKFMDIQGNDLVLNLVSAQTASASEMVVSGWSSDVQPTQYFIFKFQTSDQGEIVYVVVPITTKTSVNSIVVDVSNSKVTDVFSSSFQNTSASGTLDLSIFNYLDKPDYSRFFHVTNTALTETMLISATVLKLPANLLNFAALTQTFSPNYSASGNKLCYASN